MKIKTLIFLVALGFPLFLFSQNPTYQVYALGFTNPAPGIPLSRYVENPPDTTTTLTAIFMFWLIKSDQGKCILVDAGFHSDIEEAKARKITGYIRPDSLLQELGIPTSAITDIILSHPHWDHVDGVDLFPNAKVWMQKEDYLYFVGDAWQDANYKGFNKRNVPMLLNINLAGNLNLIDGDDKEILPGIRVYTGAHHTFNSQYVVVQCGIQPILIASDNLKVYYNLEHMVTTTANNVLDPGTYLHVLERMKTLVPDIRYIIPGHDAQVFARFPTVAQGIVQIY